MRKTFIALLILGILGITISFIGQSCTKASCQTVTTSESPTADPFYSSTDGQGNLYIFVDIDWRCDDGTSIRFKDAKIQVDKYPPTYPPIDKSRTLKFATRDGGIIYISGGGIRLYNIREQYEL